MFHKDFNLTPRVMLFKAELSNESRQQLNDLSEEFSDIMSQNSTDIGLTHLEDMVLPTEPVAAPVALNHMTDPLNITHLSKKN